MSGYLICLYRKQLSDTQLSDAIEHMRRYIKKSAPEPRFNTQNFKQLLNFVLKEVPKLIPRLRKGPMGEKPAFQVPYTRVAAPTRSVKESSVGFASSSFDTTSKPVKTATKRKRPVPSEKDDDEDSDSDFTAPAKKAPRKSESKPTTGRRFAVLKQPAAPSPARTTIKPKRKLSTGSPQASTSILNTPPVLSAARSSVSTANTKLGAQVARPSVKPSSAARTTSVSSHRTGGPLHSPLSNCLDKPTPLGSAALLTSNSSTFNTAPQILAPVPKPPLPGRRRPPGAFSATTPTTPSVEQDFHLPLAPSGRAMSEAVSLFDPSVQVTKVEDLHQDVGSLALQNSARNGNATLPAAVSASTGSRSSDLPPSSSIRTSNTTSMNKLPNIKFKKNSFSEQTPIPSAANEAQWQADTDALLNSIAVVSNSQSPLSSASTPPLLRAPRNPYVSPSSLSPMVSQQVLAPQPPARSNPGGGVHKPGEPVTPMTTPSPTSPQLQPRAPAGTDISSPSSATTSGFSPPDNWRSLPTGPKSVSSSSNCASASNVSDPRLARMDTQAQSIAAHQARNASQTQSSPSPTTSTMLTPPMSSSSPWSAGDPPWDAPKRPRGVREALQAGHWYESVDGNEQQQQQAVKRGRSYPGGGRQNS